MTHRHHPIHETESCTRSAILMKVKDFIDDVLSQVKRCAAIASDPATTALPKEVQACQDIFVSSGQPEYTASLSPALGKAVQDDIVSIESFADSIYEYNNKVAIVRLNTILQIEPNNAKAWYLLAIAYDELTDELECNDGSYETGGGLAGAWGYLPNPYPCGNYAKEALAAAKKAMSLDPNEAYIKLANKLANNGFAYSEEDRFQGGI